MTQKRTLPVSTLTAIFLLLSYQPLKQGASEKVGSSKSREAGVFDYPVYSKMLDGSAFIYLFSFNTPVMLDKTASDSWLWNAMSLSIYSSK